MAHFSKLGINGKVIAVTPVNNNVILNADGIEDEEVGRQYLENVHGWPLWKKTSYNTRGNVHYGQDGQPDGGIPLRANYATIGSTYDAVNDVFYPPKMYNSWVMNDSTWTWEAPVAEPDDGKLHVWNEETLSWDSYVPKTPVETIP